MADLRITSGVQPPISSQSGGLSAARADAVKAAQRAFFDAALAKTNAPSALQAAPKVAAPAAAAPPAASSAASASTTAAATGSAEPPARLLRPGSLLDIKV